MDRYLIILIFAITCIIIIACTKKPFIENYGGPVKNSRKLPMTDCYNRCNIWTYRCMRDRPGDEYRCTEMGNACRAECYFSNSHRQ